MCGLAGRAGKLSSQQEYMETPIITHPPPPPPPRGQEGGERGDQAAQADSAKLLGMSGLRDDASGNGGHSSYLPGRPPRGGGGWVMMGGLDAQLS